MYRIVRNSLVDDAEWVTLECTTQIGSWINTQSSDLWYCHTGMPHGHLYYDIHEELLLLIKLKYG